MSFQYLEEFENEFQGQKAVIIGAGPSVVLDIRKVPSISVLFGVNRHANILPGLNFIVCSDKYTDSEFYDIPGVRVLTTHKSVLEKVNGIHNGCCPSFGFSGCKAVWCADYMGFDEIYLCGFDCYQGNRTYWTDRIGVYHLQVDLDKMIEGWVRVKSKLSHPERVKVISGPLQKVFHG